MERETEEALVPAGRGMTSTMSTLKIFEELERGVYAALKTYSNVHRGTGHYSLISTLLFEKAREIVLRYFGLDALTHVVIFCTPHRLWSFTRDLSPSSYHVLSSQDVGLPLGVRALVVEKRALPKGVPFQTGGGVIKLVSPDSVVWADVPERFEAGTPAIINVIAFAKALLAQIRFGCDVFENPATPADILADDLWPGVSGVALLERLRDTLVGRDVQVPTSDGLAPYCNLDNAASTPTFEPIWNVVCRTWRQPPEAWPALIETVRARCATFLGAPLDTYDILFTSNATEGINLVARGFVYPDDAVEPVVLNTLLEHHSNELPWRYHPKLSLVRLSVDDEGFVDVKELEDILRAYNRDARHGKQRICLVAVSGASNVLGTVHDLAAISRVVHAYGAHLLVDGAQLVAHRKVRLEADAVDYFVFSAHKAYAPFGSGALVARKGLLQFTFEEIAQIRASGEENVVGIAALGKAVGLLQRIGMDVLEKEERALTRRMLCGMAAVPEIEIYGLQNPDSPRFCFKGGVICFSFRNIPHNLAAQLLAEYGGIGVRDGCFCAHLISKRMMGIHPLRSWAAEAGLYLFPGFTMMILPGIVRVSLGIENTEADVDLLLRTLARIAQEPRSALERFLGWTRNGIFSLPNTETGEAIRDFAHRVLQSVYGMVADQTP